MNLYKMVKYALFALTVLPLAAFCQTAKQYDSLARLKEKRSDLQGAVQQLNMAIQLDSGRGDYYRHRGNVKSALNDHGGAIADFTKALKLSPDAGTYYLRGMDYYVTGDYKNAMADFDAAIDQTPDLTYEIYFIRGNIKLKQLDYSGGVAEYTKCIAMKPAYAKAYYNRGLCKYYANLKSEACKDITKAKELGNTDVDPAVRKYCDYYATHN